jgi:hypothetical protein
MSEHEAWQDSCIIVRSHERCNDVTCEGSFSLSIEDAGKELLPVSHCPTSLEICISGVQLFGPNILQAHGVMASQEPQARDVVWLMNGGTSFRRDRRLFA